MGDEKPPILVEAPVLPHKASSQCFSDKGVVEFCEEVQLKRAKTSNWGIGRKIPMVMISSYIFAFLIAGAHLGLFLYLDGKPVNGDKSVPGQSYVSATSNILANIFGLALSTSVGIVFTQYLWYLLRQSAWKLSSIEYMFSMQTDPTMLRHPGLLKSAPLLSLLALVMWSVNIAANFAPGALIVGPIIRYSNETRVVPTFNSTYVGNGSGVDANFYSLDPFQVWNGTFLPDSQYGSYSANLARLTTQTMIVGAPSTMTSPCGTNCSYNLSFEAPFLQCPPLHTSYNMSSSSLFNIVGDGIYPVFQGQAYDPYLSSETVEIDTNSTTGITPSQFTFTSYEAVGSLGVLGAGNGSLANRIDSLNCTPASILYTVVFNFTNNILSRSVISGSVKDITDLVAPVQSDVGITFPGFLNDGNLLNGYAVQAGVGLLGIEPLNWTSTWRSWYSNLQMMAVINSMARSFNGTYIASAALFGNATNTFPPAWGLGDDIWDTDVVWVDDADGFPTNSIADQYLRSTIAAYTKLNDHFAQFNQSQATEEDGFGFQNYPLSFTISQEIFNEFLLNTTLSMISDMGWWTTSTTVTTWASINSFLFSKPLHLLLPYCISLTLALPILGLGAFALRRNGISSMNNSFLQIATSTTGSKTLEKALAASCLGGDENVTKELGELRIRFGELKGAWDGDGKGKPVIRRAGFGIEEEVKPLLRGGPYGVE